MHTETKSFPIFAVSFGIKPVYQKTHSYIIYLPIFVHWFPSEQQAKNTQTHTYTWSFDLLGGRGGSPLREKWLFSERVHFYRWVHECLCQWTFLGKEQLFWEASATFHSCLSLLQRLPFAFSPVACYSTELDDGVSDTHTTYLGDGKQPFSVCFQVSPVQLQFQRL